MFYGFFELCLLLFDFSSFESSSFIFIVVGVYDSAISSLKMSRRAWCSTFSISIYFTAKKSAQRKRRKNFLEIGKER